MMKQQKMGFYYYKKITLLVLLTIILQVVSPATLFASYIMWPSEMNLYNDTLSLDAIVSTTSIAPDTKKGFLLTGDPKEVFTLGAGHIAINVTLSGKGHVYVQFLEGLKKRGVKITLILINDKPPVGVSGKGAPEEFSNPYCYMIDFSANNGEWQKYNFDRIVDDYGDIVDNWVLGNEINSQIYNFYGPADIKEYTKVYCESFKTMYQSIKKKNPNANCFISFDQIWNQPQYRSEDKSRDVERGKYRYNAREQLDLINIYLDKSIEWGVALHPYPSPVESAKFWDDEYAGFDIDSTDEKERPYIISLKNFELALDYINLPKFLYGGTTKRKVLVSEVALTSDEGEDIQAAGLYYLWEKMMKYDQIDAMLYNAQTDLPDGLHFGLSDSKRRKRIIWAVFKDMDKVEESAWCKDLLMRVLDEYDYDDVDTVLIDKKKLEEGTQKNAQGTEASIIFSSAKK